MTEVHLVRGCFVRMQALVHRNTENSPTWLWSCEFSPSYIQVKVAKEAKIVYTCIYGIQLNVSKERFRCDSDASPKILTSWWQKKERITMMELQLPGPTSEAEWIRIGKDSNQTGISKKTWFVDKKCDSSLSIHAWYEEDVLRRGSCPWPRPSSFPGFAVTFEEEDLLFLGFFGQAPLGLLWSHRVPSCSSASSCWSHSCQRCRYAGGKLRCKPGFSESFRDHDSKVANLKSERYTQLTPTG